MYVGLPIVASNCRGNRDLIQNDKNGYVIDQQDADGFSKALQELYKNQKIRNQFGKERKKIIQNYMLDSIMIDMKNIYHIQNKEEL